MAGDVKFLVNRKVEIIMDDGIYVSNIQDVEDEYAGISIPVKDGSYLPLKKGDRVEGVYYSGNGLYKFYTVAVGRKIDRIMMILLAHPEKFIKFQRRNYVRVPIVIKVFCAILDKTINLNNITDNQFEFFDAFSLDISAGGMRLSTDRDISIGDIIMITLPLKNEVINVKGKVVRVERARDRNICGIGFMDVDNKTVEKIIQLLFQIMREQRKNAPKED
ncbi:flagellar brake protein [Clostridium lundense]|uniref:flagellar brake protein n=1 Tax=Clostridium lundense TaxID=319475 RepID=UPI000488501E|nr:flagellar brake domain-containing protein [Clostridium lundense]